jgi:hypothetical protein
LLVKPVIFPQPPAEPDLDRAKAQAVLAALSALPLHDSLADSLRRINRLKSAEPNPDAVFQRNTPINCEADYRAPSDVAAIERFEVCGWKRGVSSEGIEHLISIRHPELPAHDRTADVIPIATRLQDQSLSEWSGRDDPDNLDIPEFLRCTQAPPISRPIAA